MPKGPTKVTIKSADTNKPMDIKIEEENKTDGTFQAEAAPTTLQPGESTEKYITKDSRITVEEKKSNNKP